VKRYIFPTDRAADIIDRVTRQRIQLAFADGMRAARLGLPCPEGRWQRAGFIEQQARDEERQEVVA